MESIGIRQLQQNAAATVERVRRGASLEVTVRGRAVAHLVPVARTLLDQLEAAGRLTRATLTLEDLGPPLPPRRGVPLPSVILAQLRADER
jgi:prevent-host-death family protein